MMPHFIIVGAQKAGSTAAIRNLALNANISVFRGVTEFGQKELEFFNQHWDLGKLWYQSHFEPTGKVTGEKTAELLHRTACHPRMFETNPNFKVIVLLRNPVERAYSQWRMAALWKKDECESFEAVVARSITDLDDEHKRIAFYNCCVSDRSSWREGYLLKGMYAEQLRSLLKYFPRRHLYIGISERIRKHPVEEYGKIFDFLGVARCHGDFKEHFISPLDSPLPQRVLDRLQTVYRTPNQDLFAILDEDISEWE